jgi:hypothetical protein
MGKSRPPNVHHERVAAYPGAGVNVRLIFRVTKENHEQSIRQYRT